MTDLTLGESIRYLRSKRGISSRTLSSMCGLSPSYIGKVEAESLRPSFDAFCAIVQALNISDAEIIFLVNLNKRTVSEDISEHLEDVDGMSTSGKV